MIDSSVDLPHPDGPVTATNSPRWTSSDAPRRARTGATSRSNVRYTSRTVTIGAGIPSTRPFDHAWGSPGRGLTAVRRTC